MGGGELELEKSEFVAKRLSAQKCEVESMKATEKTVAEADKKSVVSWNELRSSAIS